MQDSVLLGVVHDLTLPCRRAAALVANHPKPCGDAAASTTAAAACFVIRRIVGELHDGETFARTLQRRRRLEGGRRTRRRRCARLARRCRRRLPRELHEAGGRARERGGGARRQQLLFQLSRCESVGIHLRYRSGAVLLCELPQELRLVCRVFNGAAANVEKLRRIEARVECSEAFLNNNHS